MKRLKLPGGCDLSFIMSELADGYSNLSEAPRPKRRDLQRAIRSFDLLESFRNRKIIALSEAFTFMARLKSMVKNPNYTCREYREEMILLGLKKRLEESELSNEERRLIIEEIRKLESKMGLD